MWSGPRNISTAMMRSWGSRADTVVIDEPLYAHYLKQTCLPHPGAAEIVAAHETRIEAVLRTLFGELPPGKTILYQKHMAHHLLPDMATDWVNQLTNCMLIREPRAMLLSLSRVLDQPSIEDTGLPQQVRLFEQLHQRGQTPPVIDSMDVLLCPEKMIPALCDALAVPNDDAMLSWEAGPQPTDGIWEEHWYASVNASTGFEPYRERTGELPNDLEAVCRDCEALYKLLHAHRLQV